MLLVEPEVAVVELRAGEWPERHLGIHGAALGRGIVLQVRADGFQPFLLVTHCQDEFRTRVGLVKFPVDKTGKAAERIIVVDDMRVVLDVLQFTGEEPRQNVIRIVCRAIAQYGECLRKGGCGRLGIADTEDLARFHYYLSLAALSVRLESRKCTVRGSL